MLYFPFLCWATFGSGCISLFIVTAFIRHLLPYYGSYWVPLKSCLPRSFRLKSSHCYQSLIALPLLLGSLNPFYYMITSVNCPFIKLFLPFEYAISSVRRGGNQSASILRSACWAGTVKTYNTWSCSQGTYSPVKEIKPTHVKQLGNTTHWYPRDIWFFATQHQFTLLITTPWFSSSVTLSQGLPGGVDSTFNKVSNHSSGHMS